MYKREFDTLLAKGSIPRAILLYGESAFLVRYYGERVVKTLGILPEEKSSFYFGEYRFETVKGILGQTSLFGDRSFVQLKIDKRIPKKEIDTLLEILGKNPSAFLLVEFYAQESRSAAEYAQDFRAFSGSFRGNLCAEVRFFAPTLSESLSLLKERARELSLEIEERSLGFLFNLQHQELALAYNELEKLALLGRPITTAEIEMISHGLGSANIEELCLALLERRHDPLLVAKRLEEEGIEEMELLMEMERFFYQLFLFFAHIRSHGNSNSADILGYKLPKGIEEQKAGLAIRLKEGHFFKIFTLLQEWRVRIMQGESKGGELFSVLIKLQAILK